MIFKHASPPSKETNNCSVTEGREMSSFCLRLNVQLSSYDLQFLSGGGGGIEGNVKKEMTRILQLVFLFSQGILTQNNNDSSHAGI